MSEFKKTSTSTQCRNFYSEGLSYINIKYYNLNISFRLMTTTNWENAYSLWKTCNDILNGTISSCMLTIMCSNDTMLTLERRPIPMMNSSGQMETIFAITKNNETIPFKFKTTQINVMENGQSITKTIECGLGAFAKTLDSYLLGTNTERHLNKMTEDYVKLIQNNNQNQDKQNYQYKKPWQKKQYSNNFNRNNQPQPWETQNQQNINSYQIPN